MWPFLSHGLWLLVLLWILTSVRLGGIQWAWLHSSCQKGDDAGNVAEDCRDNALGFGEVAHHTGGTCAGARVYRECS